MRITKPPTTDPPTVPPLTHWPPTHRPVLNRPTESPTHRPPTTDLPTQLTTIPVTQQTYFNRVTIETILSAFNFNLSFGLGTIHF